MTPDQWIERHRRAWQTADADEVVDLFTAGASDRSSVFREPYVGSDAIRQYWQRGAGIQRDVTVGMGWPVITDARVAAEWWTTVTDPDEGEITLPGCLGPCDAAGLAAECETRIGAVELQVHGPGMLAQRASSLLVFWSFLCLILGRVRQFLILLGRGDRAREAEILALRHQVAVLRHRVNRPDLGGGTGRCWRRSRGCCLVGRGASS